MHTPSAIGEAAVIIAVVDFARTVISSYPYWFSWIWFTLMVLLLIDWSLGGIIDTGICKECL